MDITSNLSSPKICLPDGVQIYLDPKAEEPDIKVENASYVIDKGHRLLKLNIKVVYPSGATHLFDTFLDTDEVYSKQKLLNQGLMCLPGSERYLPDLIAVGENRLHKRKDGSSTVIEQKMHGYTYCQEIIGYAKKFVEDIFSDSVLEGPVTL